MALLDPEKIADLAAKLVEHAHSLQLSLLILLAGRLKRDLDSKEWATLRSGEISEVERLARRLIEQSGKERTTEVIALATGAYSLTRRRTLQLIEEMRIEATVATFKSTSPATAQALARDLAGRLAETDTRILRSTTDAYRQVIGLATQEGLGDGLTRRKVAQRALDRFADRGVSGFVDAAGKQWNLASYTEMAARTAALNASRLGVMDGCRAAGRDLVMVGGSSSTCPDCAPWEGEVLSLDGLTPGYPTLAEAESAGLHHPNCTHSVAPYIEGLTDTSSIQHGDPERYEARQQQRYLERGVRHWKQREAAAMDDLTRAQAAAKTHEWQGKLREHVAINDLKRLSYREQINQAI